MYLFSPWTLGQGHEVQGTGEGIECQSGGLGVTLPGICGAGWSQGNDECLLKACGSKLQGRWPAGHVGLSGHIPVLGCRPGEDP